MAVTNANATSRLLKLIALLCCMSLGGADAAERMALGAERLSIGFKVDYLAFLSIAGRFGQVTGDLYYDATLPVRSSLRIVASTASISTGSTLRDETLRSERFFDAMRHPRLTFESARIEMSTPYSGRVIGKLTMLGVTREVALAFVLRQLEGPEHSGSSGRPAMLHATGAIRRSEWGMTSLLPAVADEVSLDVRVLIPRHY